MDRLTPGSNMRCNACSFRRTFYFESSERDPAKGQTYSYRINDFELASRPVVFWGSSIPDDDLLELARRGAHSKSESIGQSGDDLGLPMRDQQPDAHQVRAWRSPVTM